MQKGGALEETIENISMQLRIAGKGVLLKQHVLWVTYGNRTFPKKGAPVDFLGVVNGIPIAIECKETKRDRIDFSETHFSGKEKDFLKDFENAGGKSFVVFAFWKYNAIYIVKYTDLMDFQKQSINMKDCERMCKKLNTVREFEKIVCA